jgi:hypothetical protein
MAVVEPGAGLSGRTSTRLQAGRQQLGYVDAAVTRHYATVRLSEEFCEWVRAGM